MNALIRLDDYDNVINDTDPQTTLELNTWIDSEKDIYAISVNILDGKTLMPVHEYDPPNLSRDQVKYTISFLQTFLDVTEK